MTDQEQQEVCFPIISLHQWYHGYGSPPCSSFTSSSTEPSSNDSPRLPLLDVRSNAEWERCHLQIALTNKSKDEKRNRSSTTRTHTVVHIPVEELTSRSYELPPRKVPFCLLVSKREAIAAAAPSSRIAQILGYCAAAAAAAAEGTVVAITSVKDHPEAKSEPPNQKKQKLKRRRQPWLVVGAILGDKPDTWTQAKDLGILSSGKSEAQQNNRNTRGFQPKPRLWQPDPMIQNVLLPLLVDLIQRKVDRSHDREIKPFELWDLGAGFGRDVCFLAEELLRYDKLARDDAAARDESRSRFRVVALDQRYRATVLTGRLTVEEEERSSPDLFWKRRGVEDETGYEQVDLENCEEMNRLLSAMMETPLQPAIPNTRRSVCCIYAVRYWNRTMVQRIAQDASSLLEVGSLFAMSTFGKPRVGATWEHVHPKEKHVLERNELSDMFCLAHWRILHDAVVMDSDHGRTLIQFVAQRV